MYLENESSKFDSVNRIYETREKSHSLLDHPEARIIKLSVNNEIICILTSIIYYSDVIQINQGKSCVRWGGVEQTWLRENDTKKGTCFGPRNIS